MAAYDLDVLCIGHSVVDVILKDVHKSDARRSDRRIADDIVIQPGGDALNQAVFLGKSSKRVGLFTITGKDEAAALINRYVARHHVERVEEETSSIGKTIISLVDVAANGQRSITIDKQCTTEGLCRPDRWIASTAFLSYASFFGDDNLDAIAPELLEVAKKQGVCTVADVTGGGMYSDGPISACYAFLDFFVPSIGEAMSLTGIDDKRAWQDIAEWFLLRGCTNVIIKLGPEGCYVANIQESRHCPPFPVENIVDTTGAGDNFVGGLLYGLASGRGLSDSIDFAQAAAAISLSSVGSCSSVGCMGDIEEFLNEKEKKGERDYGFGSHEALA